jgi:pimeloyl-ACP methyl ester carboxylesterase
LAQARDAWEADPGSATACRAFYDLWYQPFYGDRAARGRSKGDFCGGTPASLKNKVEAVDRYTMPSLGEYDWRLPLRRLAAPTLVVHGSVDVISVESALEWAATPADARLLLLEGVGHFPYVEVPEQFFTAVSEFVKGRWPQGARKVAPPRRPDAAIDS